MTRISRGKTLCSGGAIRLVLFDIDGTLLFTGGAGKRALNRAFEELFGTRDAFTGISVAGRTDALIVDEALSRSDVIADKISRELFFVRYFDFLKEEIVQPGPKKGLMPGVRKLLEKLVPSPGLVSALLTGNFARAAKIKLEYFGIWNYFACGAYGDDAPSRNDLVPIAVDRARNSGISIASPRDAIVVGDTPFDVQCATAVHARSIAVATGPFSESVLRDAGADEVLPDLSDTKRFLAALDDSAMKE